MPAVADCVETVKTFATEEHVKIISTLLELLGPTHATALPTQRLPTAYISISFSKNSGNPLCMYVLQLSLYNYSSFILLLISNRIIAEFQAKLFDPRSYSWRVKESESVSESVFVRPILLRTLSLSAAADAAYRQYESPDAVVPPLPCTPVPVSK